MTMVILSGDIDLSVGFAIALCGVVGASLAANVGLNAPLTVAIMVGLGAVIGGLKGVLIAWKGINCFIVTLGMMPVLRGLALTFTGGYPISGVPDAVRLPGFGVMGGIPMPLVVSAIVFGLLALLLSKTLLGRHIYDFVAYRWVATQISRRLSRADFRKAGRPKGNPLDFLRFRP